MRRTLRPSRPASVWAHSRRYCATDAAGMRSRLQGLAYKMWQSTPVQLTAGFAAGVSVWLLIEQWDIVPPSTREAWGRALMGLAHRQRHDDATSWIPKTVRDELDARGWLAVPDLASSPSAPATPRTPFSDILRSCSMEEQLDWLAEHVSDDIPFFYLEELVHTFAALHFPEHCLGTTASTEKRRPRDDENSHHVDDRISVLNKEIAEIRHRAAMPSSTPDGADELIRGLWHFTASGTLSPQAGFGALAVLTSSSPAYAVALAKHVAVDCGGRQPSGASSSPPPRFAVTLDEVDAVNCFEVFVDECRRAWERRKTTGTPDTAAQPTTCGAPLALPDGRTDCTVALPPINLISAVARKAYINDNTSASCNDAAIRLALDPLAVVIATVDAAVKADVVRHQKRRYGVVWREPSTWMHLVTAKRWPPPPVADAVGDVRRSFPPPKSDTKELTFTMPSRSTATLAQYGLSPPLQQWLHQYACALDETPGRQPIEQIWAAESDVNITVLARHLGRVLPSISQWCR